MCERPKFMITHELVHHPRCDRVQSIKVPPVHLRKKWLGARFMCIFEHADLATAALLLAKSMHNPFRAFPIACVAVHKAVRDKFVEMVRTRFRQLAPSVVLHPNFERTVGVLKNANIDHIVAHNEDAPAVASPILVPNATHFSFGGGPTGVTTLHTFETIKEAADVFLNETPPFDCIHVFDDGVSNVYGFASRIKVVQFYVNCMEVNIMPIMQYYTKKKSYALLHNGYHYETLPLDNNWKIIIYPYGSTFNSPCNCLPGQCFCRLTDTLCHE